MQQISVITLGVSALDPSQRFYQEGFGWTPVFSNPEIVFYQMNGLMLGTWLKGSMSDDMGRPVAGGAGAYALAHNVPAQDAVEPLMARLVAAGGRLLKAAAAPPHGGYSGYVADPDDHAWEIAWNPAWAIDAEGRVSFGL